MKTTDTHVYFWRGIFSNWHPCKFEDDEFAITFNNTEQAFMYEKAKFFGDFETAELIVEEPDPKKAKALGRAVKNYNEFIWSIARFNLMVKVNLAKYKQNSDVRDQLMETGDKILVEASPYDGIWGVKLGEDDPRILDVKQWKGSNLLGKALMNVRKQLK